jgi:hypothetical protein
MDKLDIYAAKGDIPTEDFTRHAECAHTDPPPTYPVPDQMAIETEAKHKRSPYIVDGFPVYFADEKFNPYAANEQDIPCPEPCTLDPCPAPASKPALVLPLPFWYASTNNNVFTPLVGHVEKEPCMVYIDFAPYDVDGEEEHDDNGREEDEGT